MADICVYDLIEVVEEPAGNPIEYHYSTVFCNTFYPAGVAIYSTPRTIFACTEGCTALLKSESNINPIAAFPYASWSEVLKKKVPGRARSSQHFPKEGLDTTNFGITEFHPAGDEYVTINYDGKEYPVRFFTVSFEYKIMRIPRRKFRKSFHRVGIHVEWVPPNTIQLPGTQIEQIDNKYILEVGRSRAMVIDD